MSIDYSGLRVGDLVDVTYRRRVRSIGSDSVYFSSRPEQALENSIVGVKLVKPIQVGDFVMRLGWAAKRRVVGMDGGHVWVKETPSSPGAVFDLEGLDWVG